MKKQFYTVFFLLTAIISLNGQVCDVNTPVFTIDLTGQPNGDWISPPIQRDGNCCGTSAPDKCIQFNLTVDTAVTMINFNIYSGAVPGGSMFYQINCGPPVAVGQPVCLSGPGPHIITFCKPGNNQNQYIISSISEPNLGGTQYVSQACQGLLIAEGLDEGSIQWTSVPYNAVSNSYLSCQSGCDSVTVTPPPNSLPAYIDYQVSGNVAGGCFPFTFTDTIRVYFVNDLAVDINPDDPTICFGGTNATLTASGSGGLMPYTYLWSTGETTATINTGPGIFTVQVFDQMNCSFAYDTVTVNALASPITVDAGPDDTLCLGELFYQLNGSVISATGLQWYGQGTFLPSDTSLNAQYYPSNADIVNGYTDIMVVTTGNFNCPPDTDYIHITIVPSPVPVIIGISQSCINSSAQYSVSPTPGNSYLWSVIGGVITSTNLNIAEVQWTDTGTNSLTVVEVNPYGCDSTMIFTIIVQPKPVPEITGTQMLCRYDNANYSIVNSNPGSVYQWSVTNGTFLDSIGNSVDVSWHTAGTGNISVVETNSFGCDSTTTFPVDVIAQPVPLISGADTVCNYQLATYTATPDSTHQFAWSVTGGNIISQNNHILEVDWTTTGTGTITLTVNDPIFCDSSITINVTILDQPSPQVSGPDTSCAFTFSEYVVNGVDSNETIAWTINGGIIASTDNNDTIQVIWQNAGIGQLRIVVTNPSGCDSIITYPVTVLDGAAPELKGPAQTCVNDTCVYSVPFVSGHNYRWTVNGGTILNRSSINSIGVYWQTAGQGVVTVVEVTPAGCDSMASMNVGVYGLPSPNPVGGPLVCQNDSNVFFTTPTPGHSYSWSAQGGNVISGSNQSALTCNWLQPGNYSISLLETTNMGCAAMVVIPIQVAPKPIASIAGSIIGCQNQFSTYTVNEVPGINYNYSITGGIIRSNTNGILQVEWTGNGINTITVTATNPTTGCNAQNYVNVSVDPLPTPYVNALNMSGCPPLNVSFHNNSNMGSVTYTWTFGDGTISHEANPDHTFYNSGNHQVNVVVTNNTGCIDSSSGNVFVYPTPASHFNFLNPGQIVYAELQDVMFNNTSNGASIYIWDFGNGDTSNQFEPVYMYDRPGIYNVTLDVVNIFGCRHSYMNAIEVIVPEDVYVPNTFTPNGDSNNDYFSVIYKNIDHATIYIFNRWGEKIYESDELDFKWDGTFKNRKIQMETYVYLIEAIGYHGTVINKTGKITVLY